jgi:N-acetylglucosaminyldiphosphoundecaprenol N-acetyl-beta-D-mannosaminyltransferase
MSVIPLRMLFDIPVAALTLEEALDTVDEAIAARKQLHIGVVNAAKIVNMRKDAELRVSVLDSDVIFADGAAVVWASRMLGQPLPERVAGIDLMTGMLRRGQRRGYRVFCLGATEQVLAATLEAIARDFPGIEIAGAHHGYFKGEREEADVAEKIKASRADILLVAMTSPKKERFLARWNETLNVPVCHGVGGSFDVVAGKVKRAPVAWQRLGLEWLYRVKQEPRRLWKRYFVTNSLFVLLVARAFARQRFAGARARDVRAATVLTRTWARTSEHDK